MAPSTDRSAAVGFGEHQQCLVGMGGDDGGVETSRRRMSASDTSTPSGSRRTDAHRRRRAHLVDDAWRPRRRTRPNRRPRSARSASRRPTACRGAPGTRTGSAPGSCSDSPGGRRPHRRDERCHEVVDEVLGEPVAVEEFADGRVVRVTLEQAQRRPVESLDLGQHEQIARTGQRRPGREQPAEPAGARRTPARSRRRAPTSTCRFPWWRCRVRRTAGTAWGRCGRCARGRPSRRAMVRPSSWSSGIWWVCACPPSRVSAS